MWRLFNIRKNAISNVVDTDQYEGLFIDKIKEYNW